MYIYVHTHDHYSEMQQEEGDVFGITYVPYRKRVATGQVHITAFEDEQEYEKELSNKQSLDVYNGSNLQNDDEFDFDIETTSPPDEGNIFAPDAPATAVVSFTGSRNDMDDAAMLKLMKDEAVGIYISDGKAVTVQMIEEKGNFDVKKNAKASLDEILSIYSNGLGDHSVQHLVDNSVTSAITVTAIHGMNINTIEEGDEEEEEQLEVDEARQQMEEKVHLDALVDEWDNINESMLTAVVSNQSVVSSAIFTPIHYDDAVKYIESIDLSKFSSAITVSDASSRDGWFANMWSSKLSFDRCESLLHFPFLAAQLDYNDSDTIMFRMLQTIYYCLTTKTTILSLQQDSNLEILSELPLVGLHWDRIGFQGLDPKTDINRSMKMFAVLQALYLISNRHTFAIQLHKASSDFKQAIMGKEIDQSWPFMCVSIMFTKEAIQALRSGALNKKCNKRRDVLSVLHDFYAACFVEFAKLLSTEPSKHHAIHLSSVRNLANKNPLGLMRQLKTLNTDSLFRSQSNDDVDDGIIKFDDLSTIA